jgi:hypothetical protein
VNDDAVYRRQRPADPIAAVQTLLARLDRT